MANPYYRRLNGMGAAAPELSLGPSLLRSANALAVAREETPINHFSWLFPGANSQHVRVSGSIVTPAYSVIGAPPTEVFSYTVPQGMRFSLRGVLVDGSSVANWDQGSGDMVFSLVVTSAGARAVDGFNLVDTQLGSLENGPWPIDGRLEFSALDVLTWFVQTFANVGQGAPNRVRCALIGHLYPNTETI